MAVCGFNDDEILNGDNHDDCIEIQRGQKTVQVPCTFNRCKNYSVKIPRQVTEQVPRTVRYTDFVSRSKRVPYTFNRSERRTRMYNRTYQVPVTETKTRMVPVTTKVAKTVMVPKTVYVDVTTEVPQQYTTMKMETRSKQIPVPYFVNVPETRYNTVTEKVPVQRTKVQMENVTKTVYDTQVRQRWEPETVMCSKSIPVYNVRSKPPPPCRNEDDFTYGEVMSNDFGGSSFQSGVEAVSTGIPMDYDSGLNGTGLNLTECSTGNCPVIDPDVADDFLAMDTNNDGVLSYDEIMAGIRSNQSYGSVASNGRMLY